MRRDPNRQDAHIFERYHMTGSDYAALLQEQGGVCRLCKTPPGAEPLHVDHDHACCGGKVRQTCGKCVRGLLCRRCNLMLGWYERFTDWGDVENYLAQERRIYTPKAEAGRLSPWDV